MATYYVKVSGGAANSGSHTGDWAASQAYASGDRVIAVAATNNRVFECTTGGTSGGTEPTWDTTVGNTTADNTVTWTCRSPTTWANATWNIFHAVNTVSNQASPGDTIYVDSALNHTTASGDPHNSPYFYGPSTTSARPMFLISADKTSGEPPATVTRGAKVKGGASYANTLTFDNAIAVWGMDFENGGGNSTGGMKFNYTTGFHYFENCTFFLDGGTSGVAQFLMSGGGNSYGHSWFRGCTFTFSSLSQEFDVEGPVHNVFEGCTIVDNYKVGSRTQLLEGGWSGGSVEFIGCDLSGLDPDFDVMQYQQSYMHPTKFINCKWPASWAGTVYSVMDSQLNRLQVIIDNSDDTTPEQYYYDANWYGEITHSTGIYRTNGAKYDGTNGVSYKMETLANVEYPMWPLRSEWMVKWNDTTTGTITATVHIVHDVNTAGAGGGRGSGASPDYDYTDQEVWLEVMYLGTTGQTLGTYKSDRFLTGWDGDWVGTAADQTDDSSEGWTTTGLTTPKKQKLEVSFDPKEKGFVHARVCFAMPERVLYYCPKLELA